MNKRPEVKNAEPNRIMLKNGKLFFSKETERKVFFFMTIIMLLMGVFVKFGIT